MVTRSKISQELNTWELNIKLSSTLVDTAILCTPATGLQMMSKAGSNKSACHGPRVTIISVPSLCYPVCWLVQGALSVSTPSQQQHLHWTDTEIEAQKSPGIWPRSHSQRIWKPTIAPGLTISGQRQNKCQSSHYISGSPISSPPCMWRDNCQMKMSPDVYMQSWTAWPEVDRHHLRQEHQLPTQPPFAYSA